MPTVDVLRPAKPACFGAEVESSGLISCPAGARRGGEVLSGGQWKTSADVFVLCVLVLDDLGWFKNYGAAAMPPRWLPSDC